MKITKTVISLCLLASPAVQAAAMQIPDGVYFEGGGISRQAAVALTVTSTGVSLDGGTTTQTNNFSLEFGNFNAASDPKRRERIQFQPNAGAPRLNGGSAGEDTSDFYQPGQVINLASLTKTPTIGSGEGLQAGENWLVTIGTEVDPGHQIAWQFFYTDNGTTGVVDAGDVFSFGLVFELSKAAIDAGETYNGATVMAGSLTPVPEPSVSAVLGLAGCMLLLRRRK